MRCCNLSNLPDWNYLSPVEWQTGHPASSPDRQTDNQYDIEAAIKLDDLNDALGTSLKSNNYDSLGGLVIELLDKLPDEGEVATTDNITLKVIAVEKNRIERILLTIEEKEENESDGE